MTYTVPAGVCGEGEVLLLQWVSSALPVNSPAETVVPKAMGSHRRLFDEADFCVLASARWRCCRRSGGGQVWKRRDRETPSFTRESPWAVAFQVSPSVKAGTCPCPWGRATLQEPTAHRETECELHLLRVGEIRHKETK